MIGVEVYKNGQLIDKGKFIAAKHYTEAYPEQNIILKNDNMEIKEYSVEKDGITFIEWSMIEDDKTGLMKPVKNYDSTTHIDYAEKRRNEYWSQKVECPTCHTIVERNVLKWVRDSHNVPYKKCCNLCFTDTEKEIIEY